MRLHRLIVFSLAAAFTLSIPSPKLALAQNDAKPYRGRKYKSPPATSHIEILVTRKTNGKPISNAAVVFNPTKDGKDEGNLEVKTDPEGKAIIDVIPTGSLVRVQIIADGFATFAEDYQINEPSREIAVAMLRPRAQISVYEDNQGKASDRQPGVQEPLHPDVPAGSPAVAPKPAPPAVAPKL